MEIRHIQDGKIVSINGKPVIEEPKKKVKSTPIPVEEIEHFNNVDVVEPIQDEEAV
jgi:hypothetical protein